MIIYLSTWDGLRSEFELISSHDLDFHLCSEEFDQWFRVFIEGRFGSADWEGCIRLDGREEYGWTLVDFETNDPSAKDGPCVRLGRALQLIRGHLVTYKKFRTPSL